MRSQSVSVRWRRGAEDEAGGVSMGPATLAYAAPERKTMRIIHIPKSAVSSSTVETRPLRSLTQLRGFHGAGSLRGSLRSRVRRGKSEHACSSNSCFAWLGLGFASTQLHAEHPQAAKVLSSSQTICLAMAGHSPTGWDGVLGQFGAGHCCGRGSHSLQLYTHAPEPHD